MHCKFNQMPNKSKTIPVALSNYSFIAREKTVRNKIIHEPQKCVTVLNSKQIVHLVFEYAHRLKKLKKRKLFVKKHIMYVCVPSFNMSSTHKLIAPLTAKLLGHCPLLIFYYCLYVTSTCKPDRSTTNPYNHLKIAYKYFL